MNQAENRVRIYGETPTVNIDRPLGSTHPRHPDIIYPINYGFVPGTLAPDGHEVDAYVLGPTGPLDQVTGRLIAIIHRADDVEQKLVVATDEHAYTAEEIAVQVHFMEQYFQSRVEMLPTDTACGA